MKTIKIICKNFPENEREFEFPVGVSLLEVYQQLNISLPYPLVAARVNYKVEDLNFLIYKPKTIEFIDASSQSGLRVYLRSISMVLAKAAFDLFPNDTLRIEHPISRGYYCSINGRNKKVDKEKIAQIKQRMQEIIAADLPIECHELPIEEAIEVFRKQGNDDVVLLLEMLGVAYVRFFSIDNFYDYYGSVLTPSTSYVSLFDLQEYKNGILLRVPSRINPNELAPYEEQPKLFDIYDEFIQWNRLMGLHSIGDFNRLNNHDTVYNLIKVSEALHEKKIAQIADIIRQKNKKIILVAGPSSSGKTTFSKRLSIQLMVAGIKPIVLSMDNYFVNRVDTPLDEYGEYDFESVRALDLDLFSKQLTQLLNGEEVEVPFYNFEIGERQFKGDFLKLNENNALIIEGIHAMNPDIFENDFSEIQFKVYVSPLTTISLDNHSWISTADTRLLRRIVRDSKYRNYTARETINRWASVRRGEDKWIFPFQEQADVMFNSSLIFELNVLRKHAEPVVEDVPQYCEEYTEAHRLLKFLKYFKPILEREIPPTSLLREFLGGSSFRY